MHVAARLVIVHVREPHPQEFVQLAFGDREEFVIPSYTDPTPCMTGNRRVGFTLGSREQEAGSREAEAQRNLGVGRQIALAFLEDGELVTQATDQPRFGVIPTSDSTVRFDGVEATVTFHFYYAEAW